MPPGNELIEDVVVCNTCSVDEFKSKIQTHLRAVRRFCDNWLQVIRKKKAWLGNKSVVLNGNIVLHF